MQLEYIKSFNFSETGIWPNEKYTFSPISENIEPVDKPIDIFFPVFGNPSIDYGIYSKNTLIDYEYGSIYKDYNSSKNKYSLNLFSGVTPLSFYYVPTHRELYPYSIFNVFGIESDNITKGFYLNPKKLFFKPIFIEKIETGWRIQLSTVILGEDPIYFQSNNFIEDVLKIYKNDIESYDIKQEYTLPTNLILKYDIKGTEKFFNKNVITFTETYNPSAFDTNIENAETQIKKNSIFLTNKHYYLNKESIISEKSYYNNEDNDFFNYNNHTYNFNNDTETQRFYIFNNPSDVNDNWLYASLNPSDSYFEYYSNTEKLSGAPDTPLSFKYITDSEKIKATGENVSDTVINFIDNGEIKDINQEFSSGNSGNIILELKYPPHYYNFNLKYKAFSDFYNLSSTLMFDGSSNDIIHQKIYDYFDGPTFIDDRYSKFAYENHPIDDSFYKSTGILLSSLNYYSNYTLNEIIELSAYSFDVIKNTIAELSGAFPNLSEHLNIEIDTDSYKTKGLQLSGTPAFSDYKYLTSTSYNELTSIIYNLGFNNLSSSVYDYYPNTININENVYITSGIYNISVNNYNDTFVQEISTYNNISYYINNIKLLTATNIPELTGIIYNLGEPYSQYAEITQALYHSNEYISTGIILSGDWICIDQQTATGADYYELTASANSFGGIYSIYAEITSKIEILNEFKTTGAYLDGATYKNILSSFAFQIASPETYYNSISTFDSNINALYNITISSYDENITNDTVLYNNISVYILDNKLYDNFVEGYSFNYNLTSKIVDIDTEYIKLSTYLFSDYHLSTLDLETYGELDLIKYEFLNLSDELKPYLSCYYSEEKIPYNIYDLDWINATSGCLLHIEYPNNPFGEVSFELVPKLSTYSGFMESYYKTKITLAENYTNDSLLGNKINLKNKNEKSNHIELEIISLSDDLENTNITWTVEPVLDNVKIYTINPDTKEITHIQNNETLIYSKNYTSTIFISGYTDNKIKISGYSEKYNEKSEIYTDVSLFNILDGGDFVIYPVIELDNQRQIRTIDLASYISQSNSLLNLPNDFSIYWIWQYGDITDSQLQPITVLKSDGQIYSCGETDTIENLSGLSIFIRPNSNYGPIENNIKIKAFAFNEKYHFESEYSFDVDDYPIEELYDLNIETYYDQYPLDVIHNTINTPILTRPLNDFSVYTFKIDKSDTSIFKFLSGNEDITWEFFDDLGFYQKITGVDQFDHYEVYNSLNWNLNHIKITVENVYLPNWNKPHTFTKTLYLNSLAESDFYDPLKLLIYPEYYWTPENPYINLTTKDNFIYSTQPLTYENKKSETYNFYVSANKEAVQYEYSTGDILTLPEGLLQIPESSELKSIYGLTISVSAFDEIYFPKENGIFYKIATEDGLIEKFMDNLTFTSIPFDTEVSSYLDNFTKSPKIKPFDTFNFTFSSIFSSINIKTDRILVIDQFILPDYKQTPIKIVDDLSTVVYTLSTQYWVATKEIEAKSGRYNIFELNIGNPLDILTISNKKVDTIYLFAEARLKKTITPDTFENYPSYENKELWKIVEETVEAKLLDDIFISNNL